MGVAFVPVYVKWLGIEAYGLIGIFTVLQTCMTLLDGGLTPTLSRELALFGAGTRSAQSIRDLIFSTEVLYAMVLLIVGSAFSLAAPVLAVDWIHVGKLPVQTVVNALRVMSFVLGLRWIAGLYKGAYIGLQKQVWLTLCTSFFATVRGVGAIVILIWVSSSITAFFIYQAAVSGLESLVLGVNLRRILTKSPMPARFSITRLLEIWRFAAGITLLTLLGILLTQFDKLILANLLPLDSFGYYAIASTVAGSLYFLVAPIANVSYPQFTTHVASADGAHVADIYHKFSQFTAVAVMPASLILIVFARPILFLWSGNPTMTDAVAPLVRVLAFGNMLHGLMHTPYMLQLAYGWTRFNVIVNSFAIVLLLPAIYIAATNYGALGAAYVWVALNLAYLLVATPLMHRKLLPSEMWRWYRLDILFPLLGGLSAIGLVVAVAPTLIVGKIEQAAVIAVASGLSLAASAVATPMGREQISRMVRRVR